MDHERRPRFRFRVGSVRDRLLAALTLTVLLSTTVITVATLLVNYRAGYRQVLDQLDSVATLKEAEISSWLRVCQLDLSGELSGQPRVSLMTTLLLTPPGSPAFQRARATQVRLFGQTIRQGQRLEEIFLMNRRGEVVVSTRSSVEGQYRGLQPYFTRGLERAGAYVQTLSFSSTSESVNTVVVSQPVVDAKGQVLGVLAGRASLAMLNDIMLERAGLGATGETYLVGSNSVLLTQLRFGGFEPGRKYLHTGGVDAAVRTQADGSGMHQDYREVVVIGVYRWLAELEVVLVAEQDRSEAFAPLYSTFVINVLVALLAVAAAIVLSIRISSGIARPVVQLAGSAEKIAEGDLGVTVRVNGPDEIQVLGQAVTSMQERLRDMIAGLEKRIVDLKAARQALVESEAGYRRIVNTATEGIWLLDGDTRTTFVNSAMSDLLGYDAAEMIGRPVTDFMFEEDTPDHLRRMENRRRGLAENYERRFRHRDGRTVWTWTSATPVLDEGGSFAGALAMFTDVSERKSAEEAVRTLNQQLERRVTERTADLQRANQELEGFTYSISHDLRAPLRHIDSFAQLLLEEHADRLDEEGRRYLTVISENVHRMGQLIDDLLAFSREARKDLAIASIDMVALSREAFDEVRDAAGERRVVLHLGDLPSARGDPALLRQVLVNLLSNAVKFTATRADAVIDVDGSVEDEETVYRVRDNGVGFDMRHANKLFGLFERLHHREEFEGTGVGLAIVRRIVLRHGGRVWAEGEVGKGASLYFSLPRRSTGATDPS